MSIECISLDLPLVVERVIQEFIGIQRAAGASAVIRYTWLLMTQNLDSVVPVL